MTVTHRSSVTRSFVLIMLIALVMSAVGSLQAATEKEAIITATKQAVVAEGHKVSAFHVSIEKIQGDYARVQVAPKNPKQTDAAWVFLKRDRGVWRVLMGREHLSSRKNYRKFHIPASIWV